MPNIYLRLPRSRCQFFRHRDPKHPLAPSDPLIFNQYMPQYFILRNSLTNAQVVTQRINDQCYSQQQWRHMLYGRHPSGGKVIIPRNRDDYLTFDEVQQLCGRRDYDKSASEDYLCIRLPNEIEIIDTVRTITPSWNLDTAGIRQLTVLLNNDFKRTFIEWALSTFDFVIKQGRVIARSQSAMLERFLMRYNIEPTEQERDSLRRIADRWLKTDHNYFSAYSCFEMRYLSDNENTYKIDGTEWV